MTAFLPHIAAMRFGLGRSGQHPDPESVDQMIATLTGPDRIAAQFPVEGTTGYGETMERLRAVRKARRTGTATEADLREANQKLQSEGRAREQTDFAVTLARAIAAPDSFRERLTLFWSDHFTVEEKAFVSRGRYLGFTEDAIRPHVSGKFGEMLKAAVLHPLMVQYLDQNASVGPNSPFAGKKPNAELGLNENLAREVLELHTLGVDGTYTQTDVREFAELLAGVTVDDAMRTVFLAQRAEPGSERVLDFSSPKVGPKLADVHALLDRLAVHPDTARHLARKLAVHFVSDDPDPDLVATLTRRYQDTNGDLAEVYRAMLSHPAAMAPELVKLKRPVDYIASAYRALSPGAEALLKQIAPRPQQVTGKLLKPMQNMGQYWGKAGGPNGWPETAAEWITANTLAERMRFALEVHRLPGMKPAEPMAALKIAVGPLADERLSFAVGASETREEAVALVLMSPQFQRR